MLYNAVMKKHRKDFFQHITGKVGHLNAIVPHGTEKETHKRDLSVLLLDGTCKRSNSTEEGGERKLRGLLEKGEGNET
jgi:hypothetical protein